MYKTLVYNPSVKVEIISGGKLYDVSRDVVRGSVTRVVGSASQASITLANKGLRYNGRFNRMDRIQITLKRLKWVKVFTGYLDSVPVLQLYPGTVNLRASCTLKRLLHTWWDPNLDASQELMDQKAVDEEVADAMGLSDRDTDVEDRDPDTTLALTPDAGMGEMLKRILMNVGNWEERDIHIQDVPGSFIDFLAEGLENLDDYDASSGAEAFKELFGYNESISTGGGGGGGLGNAVFTEIGPPANGSAYTMDELVAITSAAGWRGDDVAIGASIIMAESGGDPTAVNTANANGTIDRGLWQINSIHEHRLGPGESWFDPAVSTRLARDIYADAGNSWQPWSTFSFFGSNSKYLQDARAAQARGVGKPPAVAGAPKSKKSDIAKSEARESKKGTDSKNPTIKNDADNESSPNPSPPPQEQEQGTAYVARIGGGAPNTSQMTVADSIAAVALYKFPDMYYTSGERYTDNGYHSKSQAADIAIAGASSGHPRMLELAQWWYDNFLGKGLLELIHANGFSNNVGDDQNVGDGMSVYYNPGTMADHRDHVHIAMSGVVSADGTTSGSAAGAGTGGVSFENKLGKSLFDYIFDPTNLDQSGISDLLTGERAPVNDEPLIKVVRSICDASMRSFQSTPDGGFSAFYPDYWGMDAINGKDASLRLEDIEMKQFHIDANDDAFTTHVYARGNETFSSNWSQTGEFGWLDTYGVATVENDWLFRRLLQVVVVAPEFETTEEIYARYGIRPLQRANLSGIMTAQMEFLAACKIFLQKWSEQYSTKVDFTFMPELFPGMRIELSSHSVAVYVEQVTHVFDYSNNGGFSTSASVTAPSAPPGSTQRVDGSYRTETWTKSTGSNSTTRTGGNSNVR